VTDDGCTIPTTTATPRPAATGEAERPDTGQSHRPRCPRKRPDRAANRHLPTYDVSADI